MNSKSIEASKLQKQIEAYMTRAEILKSQVKKTLVVKSVHQRIIEEDSVGHSYENIFKGIMDERITVVRIEEPYLEQIFQVSNSLFFTCINYCINQFQMFNLVRFCEMLVNHAPNLKRIFLTTKATSNKSGIQELARSLAKKNIMLMTEFQEIHDREIQ